MDFTPFSAPASDHDPFHTGLSAEKGVTPKNFVEGVNAYFTHIFEVLKGDVAHAVEIVDDDARAAVIHLAEHVTSLEKKMDMVLAAFSLIPQHMVEGQPATAVDSAVGEGQDPHASVPPPNNPPPAVGVAGQLQVALKQATGQ